MRTRVLFSWLLPLVFLAAGCSLLGGGAIEDGKVYRNPENRAGDLRYLDIGMPPFPRTTSADWLNGSPEILDSLRGKVVLVDFWDYTCVNCIRTLPYMKEWYSRYAHDGLVIIGVHSPEFAFAKKRSNLAAALKRFGITYPVVMDNDFTIWKSFDNSEWPEKYLFDKNGILRYVQLGEGSYGNTEEVIQRLLKEINPKILLPPLMKPVRATDAPGAVCYLTTPETFLGYARGKLGNPEGYTKGETALYSEPKNIDDDRFYLVGEWQVLPSCVRYMGATGDGRLMMDYVAAQVQLVIKPEFSDSSAASRLPFRVFVLQDGKPLPKDDWSRDIKEDSRGKTYITVKDPGMYYLVSDREYGRHILTLEPTSDAFAAYSFTFGTACESPGV